MDITLASICWENDYDKILNSDYGHTLFATSCGDLFQDRLLIINNVKDHDKVAKLAEAATNRGMFARYLQSDDCVEEVFHNLFGGITRESFLLSLTRKQRIKKFLQPRKGPTSFDGYCYSIAPLCAIYYCKTEWLLFFTGDAYIKDKKDFEWIPKAIELMNANKSFIVASLVWNDNYVEAEHEKEGEVDDFWINSGFSDQCFLVNVKRLRAISGFLNEKNPLSERFFPDYGGQDFERRFNAYMRNHGLKRLTYKYASYFHPSH